jgi:hypothetical protein
MQKLTDSDFPNLTRARVTGAELGPPNEAGYPVGYCSPPAPMSPASPPAPPCQDFYVVAFDVKVKNPKVLHYGQSLQN